METYLAARYGRQLLLRRATMYDNQGIGTEFVWANHSRKIEYWSWEDLLHYKQFYIIPNSNKHKKICRLLQNSRSSCWRIFGWDQCHLEIYFVPSNESKFAQDGNKMKIGAELVKGLNLLRCSHSSNLNWLFFLSF